MTLFRILRTGARSWWYHAQMRNQGDHTTAREWENRSVRGSIDSLRNCKANGGFLSLGRGGFTLHIGVTHDGPTGWTASSVQGHDCDGSSTVLAALAYGIPCIDSRTIPDDRIYEVVQFPMCKPGEEDPGPGPWGPYDYAPLAEVAGLYGDLGATLSNF